MKLTWYGHSAFRVEVGNARILIDPYFTGNPSWNAHRFMSAAELS